MSSQIIIFAVIAFILIAWNMSALFRSREGYSASDEPAFPVGEANLVTKPYESSVAQCHLTTSGCLKNVRWREPLSETHVYDPENPQIRRSGAPVCSCAGTTSCSGGCHP